MIRNGDRIFSRAHKGEIYVDVAGSRGVCLGRKVNKDGKPGRQDVVVDKAEISAVWLPLPGVGGGEE